MRSIRALRQLASRASTNTTTSTCSSSSKRGYYTANSLLRMSSKASNNSSSNGFNSLYLGALATLALGISSSSISSSHADASPSPSHSCCHNNKNTNSSATPARPIYRRSEVAKHQSDSTGYWVTYKDGVYDVTNFLASHPGGRDRLMMAVGGDLSNFWRIPSFRLHFKSPLAMELLSELRIGDLHPDDVIDVGSLEPEPLKYSTDKIYDCIVVGSGVSGLQTYHSLTHQHGIKPENILVLEAQDYVGGRIRQMTEFVKGVKIDVGAEFLHGNNTELTRFAEEHKEPIREIYCWAHGDGGPLQEPVGGGYGLYFVGDKKGNRKLLRYDSKDEQHVRLNEALWDLADLKESDYSDKDSLLDYLKTKGLNDEMIQMAEAGYANTLCTNAKDLSLKRVIKWSRLWHGEGEEEGDFTFINSFGCVIDTLKKGAQIELNSPVAEIDYARSEDEPFSDLVKLKTLAGNNYYARSVVVTSSPHVLKSGLVKFDPPMTTELKEALETTNMHNIIKVVLKFEKAPWPKNLSGMIMVDNEFLLPEIWFRDVTGKTAPGEKAQAYAIGFTTSEYAKKVALLPKAEVLNTCVKQLDTIFSYLTPEHMTAHENDPNKPDPASLPKPSEVYLGGMFWDWNPGHHPYVGGGYASPKAGTNADLCDRLREPYGVKGNIYFAGEATNLPGATAHAAMGSGIRAAEQVSAYLKDNKR